MLSQSVQRYQTAANLFQRFGACEAFCDSTSGALKATPV